MQKSCGMIKTMLFVLKLSQIVTEDEKVNDQHNKYGEEKVNFEKLLQRQKTTLVIFKSALKQRGCSFCKGLHE